MENELQKRLFKFASDVFNLLKNIRDNQGYQIYKFQLIKSSSSSGANYEESQGASSRADFINKVLISLKEMRESTFFLRLLDSTYDKVEVKSELHRLIKESIELKKILGAIAAKTRSTKMT